MNKKVSRDHWQSQLGFILAAAGSAIGLGTLWRLPYAIGENGGGAFLLVFLGLNLVLGIPFFMAELVLGRETGRGSVGSLVTLTSKKSAWHSLGWLAHICAFMVLSWYCVVAGWGMHYMFLAVTGSFAPETLAAEGVDFVNFRANGLLNLAFQTPFLCFCRFFFLIMGAIVLFIVLAVLLPIFQLNQFTG